MNGLSNLAHQKSTNRLSSEIRFFDLVRQRENGRDCAESFTWTKSKKKMKPQNLTKEDTAIQVEIKTWSKLRPCVALSITVRRKMRKRESKEKRERKRGHCQEQEPRRRKQKTSTWRHWNQPEPDLCLFLLLPSSAASAACLSSFHPQRPLSRLARLKS